MLIDFEFQCKEHMGRNGMMCSQSLIIDSKIHRYSADNNKYKVDEWYVAHTGNYDGQKEYLMVIYGSWTTGARFTYTSYEENKLSTDDSGRLKKIWKERSDECQKDVKEKNIRAAQSARGIWYGAEFECPDVDFMAYPRSKGINPLGCKYAVVGKSKRIVIPLRDIKGEIKSLQYIYQEHGRMIKRFLTDGAKKGNFCVLGEFYSESPLFVVEGWATGVTIHRTMGSGVVIAFDAGNIIHVIKEIREAYPTRRIIIAADNDPVGLEKAYKAGEVYGCEVIFPRFHNALTHDKKNKPYTDFNDLASSHDIQIVINQLMGKD